MAMTSETTLVSTPRKVSFRASDNLACQATIRGSQGLWLLIAVVSEDFGQLQESGAEANPGALCGIGVDRKSHAALFDEEADDATHADEFVAVADGEDRRAK